MRIAQDRKSILSDISLWVLIASNMATTFLALLRNWDPLIFIWTYWCQSVAIGIVNFIRIIQLKEFSTEGVRIQIGSVEQPLHPTEENKLFLALFFLFHYGFFHFGYLVYLLNKTPSETLFELRNVFQGGAIFFINHLFSYFYNRTRDTKKLNIGHLMLYPYARILPMHFVAMFGFAFKIHLFFFILLKILADALMHIIEHTLLRRASEKT